MTNYDELKDKYLSKPKNKKLYDIEILKLKIDETIDELAKTKSAKERETLFIRLDKSVLDIKEHCFNGTCCRV
ncbi:MAG: hypothetical protein HXX81_00955 [Campylobacterales bacterium]|nr:hypothetical protein [Campylobacterales bacterium]